MRRKAQGFTLIEIMVVIAIIAGLVTTVAVVVPKMQERQQRLNCMNNLSQLSQLYMMAEQDNRQKAQKYSGVALWLNYRKNGDPIKRGDERVLICQGDSAVRMPETEDDRKAWDNVDLDNPADDLCSYAGRDFKEHGFDVESKEKEIVGCDRQGANGRTMHHPGGIVVAYKGGSCNFLTRDELSVSADQNIVVGPEAENPMLKKLVYRKQRRD